MLAYLSSNPPNPKAVFRHGDWICPRHSCAAHNFGSVVIPVVSLRPSHPFRNSRNLACIGCGCPRSSLPPTTTTTLAASPRMASHVFYSSAQPHQAHWHQPPIDLAQLNTQLAGLSLQQQHHQVQPPKQQQPVAQHAPPLAPPKFTPPLLTPSGKAFAIGGRVQNISSDPLSPCIMWWPDNEPFPEQGQIRPNNVVGVAVCLPSSHHQ